MKSFFMSSIVVIASLASSLSFAGSIEVESLKDVAVAHQNEDGTYSVVCTNGNRETVTAVDVRLGNVCPNDKNSEPTQILSLQRRSDGQFDIVCRDLSKVVATEEQIIAGQVCTGSTPPPSPEVVIEDGIYSATGSMDCTIKAQYENGKLTGLSAAFVENNTSSEMTCDKNICTGRFTRFPQLYKIEVKSKTSFEFSYDEGQGLKTFNKVK